MLLTVENDTWTGFVDESVKQNLLKGIETGKVIFFPKLAFELHEEEKKFLTADCADPKSKNISFDPHTSILRGSACTGQDLIQLREMIARFSQQAHSLIRALFPPYRNALRWGRTSFRPVEILGRKPASYRKDDTRLHVDSFASKPIQGLRLLRVFANINPYDQPRVWRLGEPFEKVAERFLPQINQRPWISSLLLEKLRITKGFRTPYDHLMLQIHDRMKADLTYQSTVHHQEVLFPGGSTWIVMTDHVSHAALAGQFLLEQTFYLPVEAMKAPEHSPLRVLERMTGKTLVA